MYGYTCSSSRRLSVSVETAIGLAISYDNGLTFKRIGDGQILAASLNEPCLVGDAFVREISGTFHMWYIFGVGWSRSDPSGALERTYKIGHAISADGISWAREEGRQIIADRLGHLRNCQALPTVIGIDGRYHMFFCYRHSYGFRPGKARGYRLGHASSDDLVEWSRNDDQMALEPGVRMDGIQRCNALLTFSSTTAGSIYCTMETISAGTVLASQSWSSAATVYLLKGQSCAATDCRSSASVR